MVLLVYKWNRKESAGSQCYRATEMSKAWGNRRTWAEEAEREEAEEREQAAAAAAHGGDSLSFPTLKEATAATTKQKKKNKISWQEFTKQHAAGSSAGRTDSALGLTPDEMLLLPTGPKERSTEEMQYGRLGGAFSNYGRSGSFPGRPMRDRDGDGRRSYGVFDDDRRAPPTSRASDFEPSRADEVDNWATAKKPLPSFDSGRTSRYGSLGMSKADEVDNWGASKKPMPTRSSAFGSSFRDSGPEPGRWTRGGFRDAEHERERPRVVLDPRRADRPVVEPVTVRTDKPNPFGAARPREEVLAEKGLDWKKLESEIEAKKSSRPTSSQSSRPSSGQSSRSEVPALPAVEEMVKPRPKANPFGDAKPREVLLEEKGMDWRKMDLELEHRAVDRPETEAEKNLKEEIDHLKKELEKEAASNASRESREGSSRDQTSIQDQLSRKERDLELLVLELDDKVRFGPRAIERPGSGAGRVSGFLDRPSSQSGSVEESRSVEFMERPRSRGTGDMWMRQADDGRAFQGGRERGFLGNREMDRSRSRERW